MTKRRDLLKAFSSLPFVNGFVGGSILSKSVETASMSFRRDYFKELGVRTFINAAGTYTSMSGCLMNPEVMDAINYASNQYANLDDLQDAVGERIAELLGCEYATITAGAFSAITLGVAGVMTGKDAEKASRLPNDTTGMKYEVILQKTHHIGYAHAIRNAGAKLVIVETSEEMEAAINENTAMMWFLNYANPDGHVQYEEFIKIGKKHGIPTMNDCAADVPPVDNLWKYTDMGFDLVCFSGGKGIRGPQSAGLLLGRRDLIEAARVSAPPRGDTVGRGMKVNKEEILGMYVALESYVNRDHQKDWELWDYQVDHIIDTISGIEGVTCEKHVPEIANHVPSLRVHIDEDVLGETKIREKLRLGHPSIQTVGDDQSVGITTWMMNKGEERIVARRIKEILTT